MLPQSGFPFYWAMATRTPFGLWLAAWIVLFTQRYGLFQKGTGSHLRYARPMQLRISPLMFLAGMVWALLIIGSFSTMWRLEVLGILGALLYVYLTSGPSEMRIDLDRKTFKAIEGPPLVPKTWEGPLADLTSINIAYNVGVYSLHLHWKGRVRGICVGKFNTRPKAEDGADELASRLRINVPIYGVSGKR